MAEKTITRMEQMEKSQQELREILARDCEEHREQMTQMIWVIMRLSREKGVFNYVDLMNICPMSTGNKSTRGY